MKQFHNLHFGKRCIIACNGPSLNLTDMSLIQKERVFVLNRGYMKPGLPISFLVVVNKNVEDQWGDEILNIRADAIFSNSLPGTYLLKWTADVPSFQKDITLPMWQGHTVTYVALQIAYYMGFSRVGIIGCDHYYPFVDKNLTGDDVNHFDPRYFPPGSRWDPPNLRMSEVAYRLADKTFRESGRRIYNCSAFTNLEVFERVPLERFLEM